MTRLTLTIAAFGTLAACGVEEELPPAGGQSGSLVPELCVEVDRITITDLDEVQPEAGHSAQEVLDAMTGSFVGTWRSQEIALQVVAAGGVDLVLIESEDPPDGTGGPDVGADPAPLPPETMCPTFQWEIAASLAVTSLPELDETADTTLVARGLSEGSLGMTLDVDEVQGTSLPDWDHTTFDRTSLDISASFDGTQWRGGIAWSSSSDPDQGGVGSGMVAPTEMFTAE